MSDFHQHGLVPTLHRIGESDPVAMDRLLAGFAAARPVAILLPCHGRDLEAPPMERMLGVLAGLRFPGAVVVAVNGAGPAAVERLRGRLRRFRCRTAVLRCDAPGVREILRAPEFAASGGTAAPGKGLNLWIALAFAEARAGAGVVLAHDTDIESYGPDLPLRLAFPVLHPELDYAFAKGYYHRVGDRLYGRVTRLFFLPLIEALLRVAGHLPLLDFLAGFRYPLAGEFAMDATMAGLLRGGNGYAIETVQLCELHRAADPERFCQVGIGPNYDHRHQAMEPGIDGPGLTAMSGELAAALLSELAAEGAPLGERSEAAVRTAYVRAATAFAGRYAHVALLNGMEPALERELDAVARFAANLPSLPPAPPVLLPAWATVQRLLPGARESILDAALASGTEP
mgnify:CR=1 FL=1